jgi:Bacterial regulatory proteins, gntR family
MPTENEIAAQLGTSRTVVREAIKIALAGRTGGPPEDRIGSPPRDTRASDAIPLLGQRSKLAPVIMGFVK